jgi:hypothetical protein
VALCAQVQFAWVRLARTDDGGDSKRTKFCLICWLGEAVGAFARAKLTEHKAALQAALQARARCSRSAAQRSAHANTAWGLGARGTAHALTRSRARCIRLCARQGTHLSFSVLERAALDTLEGAPVLARLLPAVSLAPPLTHACAPQRT